MFGDMGHGSVLLLVGIMLCLFSPLIRAKAPGMEGILAMRYIILLMGLFAAYCGLVYNDFMAIPIWFFDSCYNLVEVPVIPPTNITNSHASTEVHTKLRV
jgi:V-type H+-transporting ATPase subunit a